VLQFIAANLATCSHHSIYALIKAFPAGYLELNPDLYSSLQRVTNQHFIKQVEQEVKQQSSNQVQSSRHK
jgi:hypothetical protein